MDCSFLVIGNFLPDEIQLAQHVLGVLVSPFCRLGEPLYGVLSILFDEFAFETFLGQSIHGVAAAVDRGGV